jgi:hypothetical protein
MLRSKYKDYIKEVNATEWYHPPVKMKWSLVKKIRIISPEKWQRQNSNSRVLIYNRKEAVYFGFIDWIKFCIWDNKRTRQKVKDFKNSCKPDSKEKVNNERMESILKDVQKDVEKAIEISRKEVDDALAQQKEILEHWGET